MPSAPYAIAGGATMSTWLPTVLPTRPSSHAGMSWPAPIGVGKGSPFHDVSNSVPSHSQPL